MKLPTSLKHSLLGLGLLLGSVTTTHAATPFTWNGWTFDYEIGINNEGLALKNVTFQGHTLLKKISLPAIHLHSGYVFIDGSLSPMPWANNATLVQRAVTINGKPWYEIGIYKKLIGIDFYQAYYLSADGSLDAHLFKRGYAEATDPFWRIDADVDGPANDSYETTPIYRTQPLFQAVNNEIYALDSKFTRIRDTQTNSVVNIYKGFQFNHPDGSTTVQPNSSDTMTIGAYVYHANEDIGLPGSGNPFSFANNEVLANQDVLLWLISSDEMLENNSSAWYARSISLISNYTSTPPDLVVDDVSWQNGVFSATVRNQGANPTPRFVGVGFYVDGVYKTYVTLDGLSPNASNTVQSIPFYPDRTGNVPLPNGDHTITAWVDDNNKITEADETNNKLSKPITISGPDTQAPVVGITAPAKDATVSATSVLLKATAFDNDKIRYVVFEATPTFGFDIANLTPITARKSKPPYAFSWDSTSLPEGQYYLYAKAQDVSGNIQRFGTIINVVTPATIQRPDITVTDFSYNPSTGQFTSTIKNTGTGPIVGGVSIGLGYLIDGVERNSISTLTPLAAGESRTLGMNGPAYIAPTGSHTLKVEVDDLNTVAEASEINNALTKTITVP